MSVANNSCEDECQSFQEDNKTYIKIHAIREPSDLNSHCNQINKRLKSIQEWNYTVIDIRDEILKKHRADIRIHNVFLRANKNISLNISKRDREAIKCAFCSNHMRTNNLNYRDKFNALNNVFENQTREWIKINLPRFSERNTEAVAVDAQLFIANREIFKNNQKIDNYKIYLSGPASQQQYTKLVERHSAIMSLFRYSVKSEILECNSITNY